MIHKFVSILVDCVQSMKRMYSDIYGEKASSDGWNQTNLTRTLEYGSREITLKRETMHVVKDL